MNVKEIVREYLRTHGFDGLCCPDAGCACLIDDLEPCSEMGSQCEPGYRGPCDGTCDEGRCDWHINLKRPPDDRA